MSSIGPDDEHDAWLREALRHAPDAQVAPPPSVSEMILREAQAKARSGAPVVAAPAPAGGFAAFWAWLARPQVAAGAASLMIATVAGVMWWDRPIDDDRGPPPLVSAPALPEAAPMAQAPVPTQSPPAVAAAPTRPPGPPAAAPEPRSAKVEPAAKKNEALDRRLAVARDSATADEAKQRSEKAEVAADKERARPAEYATRSTPPSVASQDAATAQPRPFPANTDRVPAAAAAGAATESTTGVAAAKSAAPIAPPAPIAAAPMPMSPPAAAATAAPVQRERADSALAGSALGRQRFAAPELQKSVGNLVAPPAATDIATLRQALASEPRRWTWQRGAGSPQPVNERLRSWLAQADAAASTRWRRAPLATPAAEQRDALAAGTPTPSHELRLWRDGRLVATLRLDGGVLRWEGAAAEGHAATVQQAELDTTAVQALEQSAP